MTVDDISREYVRRVWIGVAKKVGKAYGWKRVVIFERGFVELDHDVDDGLWIAGLSLQKTKLSK